MTDPDDPDHAAAVAYCRSLVAILNNPLAQFEQLVETYLAGLRAGREQPSPVIHPFADRPEAKS